MVIWVRVLAPFSMYSAIDDTDSFSGAESSHKCSPLMRCKRRCITKLMGIRTRYMVSHQPYLSPSGRILSQMQIILGSCVLRQA